MNPIASPEARIYNPGMASKVGPIRYPVTLRAWCLSAFFLAVAILIAVGTYNAR